MTLTFSIKFMGKIMTSLMISTKDIRKEELREKKLKKFKEIVWWRILNMEICLARQCDKECERKVKFLWTSNMWRPLKHQNSRSIKMYNFMIWLKTEDNRNNLVTLGVEHSFKLYLFKPMFPISNTLWLLKVNTTVQHY